MKTTRAPLSCLIVAGLLLLRQSLGGCTVGCAMGVGSADGRPISWKNRDGSGNHGIWFVRTGGPYNYIAMGPHRRLKMGVNDAGLSMQNSLVTDLGSVGYEYSHNTMFKDWVLTHCASVADVRRAVIEDTSGAADHWPPPSICPMFSDAHGQACGWELAGRSYYEYDPTNPKRLAQIPEQFVCRTNTSHRRRDDTDNMRCGCDRYQAAFANMRSCARSGGITIEEMIRISRYGEPGVHGSTSKSSTRGAMIVHGVNEGEDVRIVTAWVCCGRPDYTCYVPVWVAQRDDLSERVTSTDAAESLSGRAEALYRMKDRHHYDDFINARLMAMEANFLEVVAAARTKWLKSGFRLDEARRIHHEAAETAWRTMNAMCQGSARSVNDTPRLSTIMARVEGRTLSANCRAEDTDGSIVRYDWDFGDGGLGAAAVCRHVYRTPGTYLLRCRVTDDRGARNSKWTYVVVK